MSDEYTKDSLQIARLEERMATMDRDLKEQTRQLIELHQQLAQVLETLSEARGGWRTLMWLAGVSSSAGGLVTWALMNLQFKH